MKKKPNTEQFKPKKDPTDFLESGAGDLADRIKKIEEVAVSAKSYSEEISPDAKIHREQKIFRLSTDLINALKRESYERSLKKGTRVTETELVEQALRDFFDIYIDR